MPMKSETSLQLRNYFTEKKNQKRTCNTAFKKYKEPEMHEQMTILFYNVE